MDGWQHECDTFKLSNHFMHISWANFPNNLHSPKKVSYRIKLGKNWDSWRKLPNGFHPHQNAIHAGHAYVTSFGWCIILNLSTTQIHLKQCVLDHPSKICWKHIWSQAYMEQTKTSKKKSKTNKIQLLKCFSNYHHLIVEVKGKT